MQFKVTVCIVTYNRPSNVLECLKSVYDSDFKYFNVILFDNCSKKRIEEKQLSKYPNLKYIFNHENIGVAGGRNMCEKMAVGEYLLFLDDDTLLDKNTIRELSEALDKNPNIGVAAPKMYFFEEGKKTDVLIDALGKFSRITTLCHDVVLRGKDCGHYESIINIDYAQNGYMARKNVSKSIGGHNKSLKMTYQETDYFLRTQRLGYQTVFVPGAKLWHRANSFPKKDRYLRDALGLPNPERIFYNMRNRSFMVNKYFVWYSKLLYIICLVHLFFLYYFYKFIIHKAPRDYFKNLAKGYWEGILIFLNFKKL